MRKLWWALVLAVVLGLVVGPGLAYADIRWCESDPVVSVNGTEVRIIVELPAEAVPLVRGPVHVFVRVPRGAETSIVSTDPVLKEQVVFIPSGRPGVVSVGVLVATGGQRFPVKVTVSTSAGSTTQSGETNRIVTVEGVPLG